jgi:hypothetical protein
MELKQMVKSAREAYNIMIPLVRLLTLEKEKKLNQVEDMHNISMEASPRLVNFLHDM